MVWEIEIILGWDIPICPCCRTWDTFYIYPQEYRDEVIASRYDLDNSFLSIYRDTKWKVRGFVNGYVSDFYTIYHQEFQSYYQDRAIKIVESKLQRKYDCDLSQPLLSLNHMWADQWCVSLTLLYHLLKTICENISIDFPHIDSIYDSILNNPIHGIHHSIWAKKLDMTSYLKSDVISDDFPVDMMFHPNWIDQTLKKLGESPKAFFRENIGNIKKIVNG